MGSFHQVTSQRKMGIMGTWWPNVFRDETHKKSPEHVYGLISSVAGCTVLLKPTVMFVQF
jgi:hypothetical protein